MNNDIIDLLQIKIEKAKRELPQETQSAIAAVDWKAAILNMRTNKGYNFEQLADLELETELLLCGLITPEDYPKELEKSMNISKIEASEIVEKMNEAVFAKIREELIKNTERKKIFTKNKVVTKTLDKVKPIEPPRVVTLKDISEKNITNEILPVPEKLEIEGETNSILGQKLSSSFQIPTVKTDHSLNNISKSAPISYPPKSDPYRLSPNE